MKTIKNVDDEIQSLHNIKSYKQSKKSSMVQQKFHYSETKFSTFWIVYNFAVYILVDVLVENWSSLSQREIVLVDFSWISSNSIHESTEIPGVLIKRTQEIGKYYPNTAKITHEVKNEDDLALSKRFRTIGRFIDQLAREICEKSAR
jgi:hypothetical protein